MVSLNNNFSKLQDNYLFSTINKKVQTFKNKNPNAEIISLGIGDVTLPLPKVCIKAMHTAVNDLSKKKHLKAMVLNKDFFL